jgi:plastocyanin
MKGVIIAVVIILILGALGYFFFISDQYKTEEPAATTQEPTEQASPSASESGGQSSNIITYTNSGFNPQSLTLKSGDSVTWTNDSKSNVQVGSDNHPTHTINQELTGNQFIVELAPGESKIVQLDKTGEWGYHNHLQPGEDGKIIVE